MAKLKARIEWQVFNDNEDVISSSYENISDIKDSLKDAKAYLKAHFERKSLLKELKKLKKKSNSI